MLSPLRCWYLRPSVVDLGRPETFTSSSRTISNTVKATNDIHTTNRIDYYVHVEDNTLIVTKLANSSDNAYRTRVISDNKRLKRYPMETASPVTDGSV